MILSFRAQNPRVHTSASVNRISAILRSFTRDFLILYTPRDTWCTEFYETKTKRKFKKNLLKIGLLVLEVAAYQEETPRRKFER